MKVLVITPTYGRLPMLGRLVASFLSQTHKDKELAIINDDKNVKIKCDIENVNCINLDKKILVGQKRNLATQLGFYDLYMHLDDDDIFLPNNIANHVKYHLAHPEIDLYRNRAIYFLRNKLFDINHEGRSAGINFVSYKPEAWFKVKGTQKDSNFSEDREFLNKITNRVEVENFDETDVVYNYGGLNYHLSAKPKSDDVEKIAEEQLKELNIKNGVFNIIPDFEEYEKFIMMEKLYKERKEAVRLVHKGLGKIHIV